MRVENRFSELLAQKRRRDKKRWTYREISQETGITTTTLSRFAQQKHDMYDGETIAKLCKFFNCTIGDLLVLVNDEDAEQGQRVAVTAG